MRAAMLLPLLPLTAVIADPPSSPPAAPEQSSASGDVHIQHAAGGRTDIRGRDGRTYVLHQAAGFTLNGRFADANFTLAPEDARSEYVRQVRGSVIRDIFVSARAGATNVTLEYLAAHSRKILLRATAAHAPAFDVNLTTAHGPLTFGDLTIELREAWPVELIVASAEWQLTAKPATYRQAADGARMTRLDVAIAARADPLEAHVAPHGLIGQGFDGLHIEGEVDDYVPDENGIFTTTAQGEGAIEGTVADYEVPSPFATEFKYGRFDAASAPPRDTSKLNPPANKAKTPMRGASGGGGGSSTL
jgi:hypothetical protein